MGSGILISVRSPRPVTALSASSGSAFGNFAAFSTRRFAIRRHASCGPPAGSRLCARCCHAACKDRQAARQQLRHALCAVRSALCAALQEGNVRRHASGL